MNVTLWPSAPAGTVAAPPSKSMAHRLLLCAGRSRAAVRGVALSEDVLATMDCLRALGAFCESRDGNVYVDGGHAAPPAGGAVLPCRESGSTLRFFLPLCLTGPAFTLTGSSRLLERPLDVYETLCRSRGIRFVHDRTGVTVKGRLTSGEFTLPGDVSSQFVSGLLFALPEKDGDSRIRLLPPVESRGYIHMTMDALRSFGVETRWLDGQTIAVPGGQRFAPPDTGEDFPSVTVEGDWSNAAFFLALGREVTVTGLNPDSLQGDRVCQASFQALDAGPAALDLSDCPDLGPVLMAYAALRAGAVFTGTRRLRLKESDRGQAMALELAKFGVPVAVGENRITVGCGLHAPKTPLDGHNDHRIVMALSLLCARTGGTITGAEAVNKSFPDFFDRLRDCSVRLELFGEEN